MPIQDINGSYRDNALVPAKMAARRQALASQQPRLAGRASDSIEADTLAP